MPRPKLTSQQKEEAQLTLGHSQQQGSKREAQSTLDQALAKA